jgi:hypothetical protein
MAESFVTAAVYMAVGLSVLGHVLIIAGIFWIAVKSIRS